MVRRNLMGIVNTMQAADREPWQTCPLCIFRLLTHMLHCPIEVRYKIQVQRQSYKEFQESKSRALNQVRSSSYHEVLFNCEHHKNWNECILVYNLLTRRMVILDYIVFSELRIKHEKYQHWNCSGCSENPLETTSLTQVSGVTF